MAQNQCWKSMSFYIGKRWSLSYELIYLLLIYQLFEVVPDTQVREILSKPSIIKENRIMTKKSRRGRKVAAGEINC
jgi:hypothetical protein